MPPPIEGIGRMLASVVGIVPVRAKLEKQFWGDVFGAVTDKYGIGWQINIGTAGA